MNLQLIALIVLGAIAACVTSYCTGVSHGKQEVRAEMQKDVDAANERTRISEDNARNIAKEKGHEIEKLKKQRADETEFANSQLQPVRLCRQPARRSEVPAVSGPASPTDSTSGSEELSVHDGRDLGPELVSYASSCQSEHDARLKWMEWYALVRAAQAAAGTGR